MLLCSKKYISNPSTVVITLEFSIAVFRVVDLLHSVCL